MNTIITFFTTAIFYLSIFVGCAIIIFGLAKTFVYFLNRTFKKFRILKYVIQFFYHREDFFEYLKSKNKYE